MISLLLNQHRQRVEQALLSYTSDWSNSRLSEAMRYSVMAGGKRIRPALCYLVADTFGIELDRVTPIAAAIEMIHSYSLIHDDLPAMDDDALRRGKATCHIKFDEATAILAGDCLQSEAIGLLCNQLDANPQQCLALIKLITESIGIKGMALGQIIDIENTEKTPDLAQLEAMHRLKTGALISASAMAPALLINRSESDLQAIEHYAQELGLMFQIIDDILDITADEETLGKPSGSDLALNKATYPALMGIEGARAQAEKHHQNALHSLDELDLNTQTLREFATWLLKRSY